MELQHRCTHPRSLPSGTLKGGFIRGGKMHKSPDLGAISQKIYFCAGQTKGNETIKLMSLHGSPA
jgi:hypothetical protein